MAQDAFHIEIEGDSLHRTLVLRGAMDLGSSRQFTEALERLAAEGVRRVVLDLQGVDFIDSLGLHALLRGRAYCEKNGCEYLLRPTIPARIQRVFNVAGVGEYIPVQGEDASEDA